MAIRTALFTAAFTAALALIFAGPALAGSRGGSSAGLSAGGNTIAGPGSVRAILDDVDTLADGVDQDVCVTVVARSGKLATDVRLDMTDVDAVVSSMVVGSGDTRALCQNNNETVQVTCVGPNRCEYSWRMDRK